MSLSLERDERCPSFREKRRLQNSALAFLLKKSSQGLLVCVLVTNVGPKVGKEIVARGKGGS